MVDGATRTGPTRFHQFSPTPESHDKAHCHRGTLTRGYARNVDRSPRNIHIHKPGGADYAYKHWRGDKGGGERKRFRHSVWVHASPCKIRGHIQQFPTVTQHWMVDGHHARIDQIPEMERGLSRFGLSPHKEDKRWMPGSSAVLDSTSKAQ